MTHTVAIGFLSNILLSTRIIPSLRFFQWTIKSNQIRYIWQSPGAIGFTALPQDGFVSVQRVRGTQCDKSLIIIVDDVEQECLDTTLKCLNGCRGMREWYQAVPYMWCH